MLYVLCAGRPEPVQLPCNAGFVRRGHLQPQWPSRRGSSLRVGRLPNKQALASLSYFFKASLHTEILLQQMLLIKRVPRRRTGHHAISLISVFEGIAQPILPLITSISRHLHPRLALKWRLHTLELVCPPKHVGLLFVVMRAGAPFLLGWCGCRV